MDPRYFLRMRVLGAVPLIEISREEFDALADAQKTLVDALSFEQKFEMALANYRTFELAAASWSLSTVVENRHSYADFAMKLTDANRHTINLLSTVRLYIDQVKRDFRHLRYEPPFKQISSDRLSKAYDQSESYRFMEALRNHVQHRSTPVHRMGARPIRRERTAEWAETFTFWTTKERLKDAGGFKSSVLQEMPDEVDLRVAARRYISSLSSVHVDLRSHLSEVIESARALVQGAIDRYEKEIERKPVGLYACTGDADALTGWVPLLSEWDDVRRDLAEKNRWPLRIEIEEKEE